MELISIMENIRLIVYVVLMLIIICSIAGLMEIYKKAIRKGKAKPLENYVVALVLIIISLYMLVASGTFKPVFNIIGSAVWLDYVAYVIAMYFLQFGVDRKIIKKIIKSFVSNFLNKAGLTDAQVKDIFTAKEEAKLKK